MKIKKTLMILKPYLIGLHYLIAGLTFPIYLFCYVNIRIFESFFNMTVRAHFFNHIITRKDRYFASLSIMLLAVYMFLFFDYLELLVVNFDLGLVEQYYYMFLEYQDLILMVLGGGFIYVLLDYLFIEKFIMNLKNKKPSKNRKNNYREKAVKENKVFVGIDKKTDKPIYLTRTQRSLHILTAGTTGTGKSQSFIFPWSYQDLTAKENTGSILVDPKGDIEFFEKLYTYYKKNDGGNKTFKIVNIADPENSHTYNPIFNGNAIEIKDRIMSSFEWSEEFYRTKAESILITLLQAIEEMDKKVTFHDLYKLLTDRNAVIKLKNNCPEGFYKEQLTDKIIGEEIEDFQKVKEQCSGLINNIDLMAHSSMSKIVNTYDPDVNILDVYKDNEIVFFSLPSQQLGQTARSFGKMLLMDLKSTSGYIEQKGADKHFFPVYIDEFAEFATPEFVGWLNKARSSGFCIHIAFQSLGDLEQVNDAFVKQVIDNTNIKMIFRVNDSDTAETFASQLGTQTVIKETERIEKSLLTEKEGMMGSVREVEEFIVHTNEIKNLEMGQCLFFTKHPVKIHGILNTDYIPDLDKYKEVKIESKNIIPYTSNGEVDNKALLIDPSFFYYTLNCKKLFSNSNSKDKVENNKTKTDNEEGSIKDKKPEKPSKSNESKSTDDKSKKPSSNSNENKTQSENKSDESNVNDTINSEKVETDNKEKTVEKDSFAGSSHCLGLDSEGLVIDNGKEKSIVQEMNLDILTTDFFNYKLLDFKVYDFLDDFKLSVDYELDIVAENKQNELDDEIDKEDFKKYKKNETKIDEKDLENTFV